MTARLINPEGTVPPGSRLRSVDEPFVVPQSPPFRSPAIRMLSHHCFGNADSTNRDIRSLSVPGLLSRVICSLISSAINPIRSVIDSIRVAGAAFERSIEENSSCHYS